jgi:hypothetical protein
MMSLSDPHLTAPDPKFATLEAATVPGMAHWGGTGPTGRTCRECEHWKPDSDEPLKRYKRDDAGELCDRRCKKFAAMMNNYQGPPVPHSQAACMFFVATARPPSIEKQVKPRIAP